MATDRRRLASSWILWLAMLVVATLVLLSARGDIDQSHAALTLLLVVLGGSAGGGRPLGFVLAIVSFVLIDYFFQPPYNLISVSKATDWVVLVAFLSAAFVATELHMRARGEAEIARRHAAEVERLATEVQEARGLREANRAKDEVLATVSHDLRTPLTTIKLMAQNAAARGDPTGMLIEEQADLLAQLVTNVLDLSRIRAGGVSLDLELNTVEDLVGAAIARTEGVLRGREIVTHVDLSEPALAGRFDFVQSLRIVGNLLDNALRYSPSTSPVEIETERDGEWVIIRVVDRGPGIAEAERDRIFEPFYRPKSEAPDAGHAGLGLSIARRLAELQAGRLDYEPRAGGGSTFALRLPAAEWSALELGERDVASS